jgi:putative ABC transport system permease protein
VSALWLRSVQRRPAGAAGLFVIVAVASAASVSGPMLVRAAEQSGLRSHLSRATPGAYDITVSAETGDNRVDDVVNAVSGAANSATTALFAPPATVVRSQRPKTWRLSTGAPHSSFAVSVSGACRLVTITSGRCPTQRGQVLLPDGTDARPGERMAVVGHDSQFTVSGTYRPGSLPAWLTGVGTQVLLGLESTVVQIDPMPVVVARDHLQSDALSLDQVSSAVSSFNAVRAAVLGQSIVAAADSRLPVLAAESRADRRVTTVVGLLTVVPLVVLCWYALVLIMQLIAVVRSREWALGRLRGLPLPTWFRSLYSEPGILLAAGACCGFAAGVAATAVTVHATMAAGTLIEPWRLSVLICFIGTVVGAFIGVAVATLRCVRLSLAALLLQSAEPTRLTRTGSAVQVLVGAAAVLAVVQLATQRQVSVGVGNLGALLPGLLAAAVSLVLIRAASRAARRVTGSPPRSARGLLVGRRLARNPTLLGRYLVVAVASAVIVFAVSLVLIMQRNVRIRADNQLGAAEVVGVRPVSAGQLLAAVRSADPSGRFAMAVEQLNGPTAGGTSRVVAVDTSRLAAVSDWRAGWAGLSVDDVRRLLAPPHSRSILLRGTRLTMTIAGASTTIAPFDIEAATAPAPRPQIRVVMLAAGRWTTATLGRLTPGRSTLTTPIECAHGCVLRSIEFENTTDTVYAGVATIATLSTDTQPATTFAADLHTTAAWQASLAGAEPGLPVYAAPHGTANGLTVHLRDHTGLSAAAVQPADGPAILPAVVARAADAQPLPAFGHAVDGTGLDATAVPLHIVARAIALPSSVADGAMVDLADVARLSDPAQSTASAQVWLSANAPPAIIPALRHAGLVIIGTTHAASLIDLQLATSPVRAVVASWTAVALLALLTMAALGAGVAIDSDRRKRYVRVLRDTGFAARTIRRLSIEATMVPAAVAVLTGVLAGIVSLLIAGPRLPLFANPAGPPLATAPAWLPTLLVAVVLIVVVSVSSVLVTLLESRPAEQAPT